MILQSKLVNLALLILGFGLGQGSLFAANTFLFWNGNYDLVANFGAANALVTFAYFIGDWGGLVYLAKETVVRVQGRRPVEASYLALSLIRLLVATLFFAGFIIYQVSQPPSFFAEYSRFASLGLFAYAFNVNGLLDGTSRAGISGLTQALPVVLAAIVLPFCVAVDPIVAGRILGSVYAVGMFMAIAIQLAAVAPNRERALQGFSLSTIWAVGRESLSYMLAPLPGHALFRVQVMLATTFLSPLLTALFLYVRQFVGIGYQWLGFFLRVDLKDFSAYLVQKKPTFIAVLRESMVIRHGAAGTLGLCGLALVLLPWRPDLAWGLLIYSPCILASSIATTLQRVFLLQSRGTENVIILTSVAVMSCLVMFPFVDTLAIWPLVGIELLSQVLQSGIFAGRWRLGIPESGGGDK
ncbi:hypothetical protein ACI7BZ_14480 [Xanthobacter sp. AM11]|uniref:hypothetical protein n=1 Tax=Xanthobacter sp. AM11 TaxID=3380643 RepID=UPI0039BF4FB5